VRENRKTAQLGEGKRIKAPEERTRVCVSTSLSWRIQIPGGKEKKSLSDQKAPKQIFGRGKLPSGEVKSTKGGQGKCQEGRGNTPK